MRPFFSAVRDYLTDPLFPRTSLRAKLVLLPAAVLYAVQPSTRALYRTHKD